MLNAEIMGKQVQLTLGRCRIEWDEANGGIFLYWRGRLIEVKKNTHTHTYIYIYIDIDIDIYT